LSATPQTVALGQGGGGGDTVGLLPKKLLRARPLFDREILRGATKASFAKLNPATLLKNPVIFVVEVGAALTTVFVGRDIVTGATGVRFAIQIAVWLWFTVLFANFAEAMAEARGKAQADALRKAKTDSVGRRVLENGRIDPVLASELRAGDVVICEAGDIIPGDGEVIEGMDLSGRIRDHRRERAGDSGVRR
jgi:potassium-transporting ATPase ATP-binding subunit